MIPDTWFYAKNGKRVGPVSLVQLQELARSGLLQTADMVLQQGTSKWQAADTVDGIFSPPQADQSRNLAEHRPPDDDILTVLTAEQPLSEGPPLTTTAANPPSPVELADQAKATTATAEADDKDGDKNWNAVRNALLIVPIYVFVALLSAWTYVDESKILTGRYATQFMIGAVPWFFGILGVGTHALLCVYYLKRDPFYAAAVGRYVFGAYMVLHAIFLITSDWPADEIQAPLSAARRYDDSLGQTHYDVAGSSAKVKERTVIGCITALGKIGKAIFEDFVLLLFLIGAYQHLRKERQDYTFEHFLRDVTFGMEFPQFGKLGKEYNWDSRSSTK